MELLGRGEHGRFRFGWLLVCRIAPAAAVCLAGGLYLLTGHFVRHWAGPENVLSAAVIAWLAVLPVRFILHHLLVSSLVMFKEVRVVRWALLREIVGYGLLSLILTPHFGLAGLVAANVLSLFMGAIWNGAARLSILAQVSPGELAGCFLRAIGPGLLALVGLILLIPAPEQMPLAQMLAVAAGWSVCVAFLFWSITLGSPERGQFTEILQRVFRRRNTA